MSTLDLSILTHLVLAVNRVGAPICYRLVSNIPWSDVNYIVFMREDRMRVPGTTVDKARTQVALPQRSLVALLQRSLAHVIENRKRYRPTEVDSAQGRLGTKSYRHQSESWSSGKVHWLLSNNAYTGMCESNPRQLEKYGKYGSISFEKAYTGEPSSLTVYSSNTWRYCLVQRLNSRRRRGCVQFINF